MPIECIMGCMLFLLNFFVQVMDIVDKWVAGGVEMRVFTDKWPDCSCAVVFYQLEFLHQQSQDLVTWESGMLTELFVWLYGFQYVAWLARHMHL